MIKKVLLVFCAILVMSVYNYGQEESKGKIYGYVFGDYFYNLSRDDSSHSILNSADKGKKDFNGFQLRRAYLGYDYNISKKFSTRFRLEAYESETTSGGKFGLFIKDAYIKWKDIFAGTNAILGISPPPTFSVSESYWGYRSIEKTIMDLRKIAPSRDFGIALKGKISGNVKYWLMAANGEGNESETNNQKRIYGHLAFEPVKNFVLTIHSDIAFHEDIEDRSDNSTLMNNKINNAFFIGYKESNNFSVGIEGFYQIHQNELNTSAGFDNKNSIGISVFGSVDVSKKLAFAGRFDYFDPTNDADYKGDVRNYVLAAVNYKPDPNFWIMPNIIFESYESLPIGAEFDNAITGRITFYFKFN